MTDEPVTVAAIDLGTHSSRLLIRRGDRTLERRVELTRLGEGVAETGRLADSAMDRVCDVARTYREIMGTHEVERCRIAATSAARDASNGAVLLDRVAEIVGTAPELLDGVAEAQLAFAGATGGLDRAEAPFLVVDIGGGSTEFAFGADAMQSAMSLDIGSVRLSEQYLESDPYLPEELSACVSLVGAWLDDIDREMPEAHHARTVIGVGGTVSTAVAVEIGLAEYDGDQIQGFVLDRAAAEDVFRTLATESAGDRAHNPGLPAGRVDTIVGGLAILVKIMRHFDLDEIVASERDGLDGLAASIA